MKYHMTQLREKNETKKQAVLNFPKCNRTHNCSYQM